MTQEPASHIDEAPLSIAIVILIALIAANLSVFSFGFSWGGCVWSGCFLEKMRSGSEGWNSLVNFVDDFGDW